MSNSSVDSSRVNYLEGDNDSLLNIDEEIKDGEELCERDDPAVMRGHKHCTKPYVKLRQYASLPIGDLEREGILTDRLIEVCSCCLGETAVPGKYALSTCVLARKGLRCIETLGWHQFLKYMDLSRNELESVEVLSSLRFLEHLDVSHNKLTKLCEFEAPLFLGHLNYSWNLIEEMVDLSEFWSLVHLDLSHNSFTNIFGLAALKYLKVLDISYNNIETVEDIFDLNIHTFCADFNNIETFETREDSLCKLRRISMSNNRLTTLEFCKHLRYIKHANFTANRITALIDLTYLTHLTFLSDLNMRGNPVELNAKFRERCLKLLQHLVYLNGEGVSIEDQALVKYGDRTFAEYMSSVSDYENLKNVPEIDSAVIPCYQNISSVIVFVGPIASKRHDLCRRVLEKFPRYSIRGINHTSRPKADTEVDGVDYHFVTQDVFNAMLLDGKFLNCSHKYGFSYGLSCEEMKKATEEIGILMVYSDVISALQLKSRFLNCKLVMMIPKSEENYKMRLRKKYESTSWISQHMLLQFERQELFDSNFNQSDIFVPPLISYSLDEATAEMMNADVVRKVSPILRDQTKKEESTRKAQSVSFNRPFDVATETATSASNALIRTTSGVPRLCALSGMFDDVYGEGEVTSNSTEMPLTMDEDKNQQSENDAVASQLEPVRSVEPEAQQKKMSIRRSTAVLNSDDMYAILQEIQGEDEFVMSVLLSKSNLCARSDSTSLSEKRSEQKNVSKTSVDGKHDELKEFFVDTQVKRRRMYLELYEGHPGLFYSSINTDSLDEAMEKLTAVLKSCVLAQKRHIDNSSRQHCMNKLVCQELIDEKFKIFMDKVC